MIPLILVDIQLDSGSRGPGNLKGLMKLTWLWEH